MELIHVTFLARHVAAPRPSRKRLIIDTHLEVWTLDPKFPFAHPERPNLNVPMAGAHRESGRSR